MRAMILAAGRGQRMRPLTDTCPKPLLRAGNHSLMEWLLQGLATAGFSDIVVNHAWLGEQIERDVGDGSRWGLSVRYSPESQALETAGAVANARQLLGDGTIALINGDIFTSFDFALLAGLASQLQQQDLLGACILVPNPAHQPRGDFALTEHGRLRNNGEPMLTFAGIGVYQMAMFEHLKPGDKAGLAPLLRSAADADRMTGLRYDGLWTDVGTPQRLAELNQQLNNQ